MKKYLLPVVILCLCAHISRGQNDNEARENYLNAETAYLSGDWTGSLRYLLAAENLLGKQTPKVQLLKVLVYEKLALEDINNLAPALEETRSYLRMSDQLPPLHQKYFAMVRQIETSLPAQATAAHDARVRQKQLEEKLAWQAEANKMRMGVAVGLPNDNNSGTELGVILGSRSRMWVLGASTLPPRYLTMDDKFNLKMVDKLAGKPYDHIQKSTIMHVGYFQGIRVMPRERDILKPFIGVRALYHGEYSRKYEGKTEQQTSPSKAVLDRIRGYGLDPGDFYIAKTAFHADLSLDVVIGAMVHLGNTTLFAGKDLINSNRLQFGAAFKIK